ncbi:uncharacterized protein DDB_G0283357-like [Contarinia nasturtii]|uniref:uncharacterized protein DDB_G0283357-like n=1 Tax=Contarinia nasturtii TaxID=265458 RepID=UPI0012D44053|nr:uncharacterized protein DDB_G0283357-like [Contarinia nasturtii]
MVYVKKLSLTMKNMSCLPFALLMLCTCLVSAKRVHYGDYYEYNGEEARGAANNNNDDNNNNNNNNNNNAAILSSFLGLGNGCGSNCGNNDHHHDHHHYDNDRPPWWQYGGPGFGGGGWPSYGGYGAGFGTGGWGGYPIWLGRVSYPVQTIQTNVGTGVSLDNGVRNTDGSTTYSYLWGSIRYNLDGTQTVSIRGIGSYRINTNGTITTLTRLASVQEDDQTESTQQ